MFGFKPKVREIPRSEPTMHSPSVKDWLEKNPVAASYLKELERAINNLTQRISQLEAKK